MANVTPISISKATSSQGLLLVSRAQAQAMLGGISVSHLRRLIKAGELRPVFLNPSKAPQRSGKLFFRVNDLEALVEKYASRANL